jgi:hypothetical protein
MHEQDIEQSDDDNICLVNKTMDAHIERSQFFFELLNHPYPMTLEHIVVIVTNVDWLPNNPLNLIHQK